MWHLLPTCLSINEALMIKTHGHSSSAYRTRNGKQDYSPTYHSWASAKSRTSNRHHPEYRRYGGRGIRMCEHYQSFLCFLDELGERPKGMTIERIDNDLGYLCSKCHPPHGNCRWASRKDQATNRRERKFSKSDRARLSKKAKAEWANRKWAAATRAAMSAAQKARWAREKAENAS